MVGSFFKLLIASLYQCESIVLGGELNRTDKKGSGYANKGKAYKEGMSHFSWGQILSAIVAGIAAENDDGSGQSRHAGRSMGIIDGNRDRDNGK